jgi:TatD DNase family protein
LPHLEAVLARARAQGVGRFVCNGSTESDWPEVIELSRRFPDIIPCLGLHPWYVGERSAQWLARLEQHLDACPAAVGEIGLDRWVEPRDEAAQETVFRAQLALARRRQLPVMVHCLRAWGWLMDVLRDEAPLPAGLLLHAYGGPAELVPPLAGLGAYFSFGGNTLDERKLVRREAIRVVPRDRLLLETDAPDILPPPAFRPFATRNAEGRDRNEPANLPAIAQGIADLLGISWAELARLNWENARRFLGKVWR